MVQQPIFKSKIIFSGENNNCLIIYGIFKLFNKEKYIKIAEKYKIDGSFNFISENKEIVSKELFIKFYPDFNIPTKNYFDLFKVKK
jgi:hypothetical protein